ncbi:hypothetical protein ASPBRDRAFT_61960 [Aspergillus brasiliensis CBS 101740]|uniref:Uncharacterized protein n=1 Tax=Aspergillus brasiliensis (strain CBS 101740 / IMI 381727 / IBT 21946) TaxID=767769 RepID=A0A1L9UVH5_ASPBC|nr:hypothetical protein ASPBRDRAFT_61960 [Aspergillus brasiliensis CBS 101740]
MATRLNEAISVNRKNEEDGYLADAISNAAIPAHRNNSIAARERTLQQRPGQPERDDFQGILLPRPCASSSPIMVAPLVVLSQRFQAWALSKAEQYRKDQLLQTGAAVHFIYNNSPVLSNVEPHRRFLKSAGIPSACGYLAMALLQEEKSSRRYPVRTIYE